MPPLLQLLVVVLVPASVCNMKLYINSTPVPVGATDERGAYHATNAPEHLLVLLNGKSSA